MRGVTLRELLGSLRDEIGHSLHPSHVQGTSDPFMSRLRRTQQALWSDWDWPFLEVRRDIPVEAGQRYYDLPEDVVLERVLRIRHWQDERWDPVGYGINDECYNQFDSERGERGPRIMRYGPHGPDQLEVWPIPEADGTSKLQVQGIRNLAPLINLSDQAELDDLLIILFAAAEILREEKQPGAESKQVAARERYGRVKALLTKTSDISFLAGAGAF